MRNKKLRFIIMGACFVLIIVANLVRGTAGILMAVTALVYLVVLLVTQIAGWFKSDDDE